MEQYVLKINKLHKNYGEVPILKDINLTIKPGEIMGIIGSSGSGKTTLLSTLVGFVKPEEGDVMFRQRHLVAGTEEHADIYRSVYKKQNEFKKSYGFAAQVPSFYEKLTVKENLEYFGELYGLGRESLTSNIKTLLKLLNLENSANVLGKNLSGGMERRLDIACALIHNPEILILDEPTADLDPVLRKNIMNLLKKINEKGTTIILSSHHLNEMEDVCSRIAVIMDKTIIEVGTPEELKDKYLKNHQIIVQTDPGEYEKIEKEINKKYKKKIDHVEIEEDSLKVITEKPREIINELIKLIENNQEKIIELKLVKPNLDQLFIALNEKK